MSRPLTARTESISLVYPLPALSDEDARLERLHLLDIDAASTAFHTLPGLIRMTDAELARIDPIVMNLTVARGIPSREELEVPRYVRQANAWARDIARSAPGQEREFWRTPQDWDNCLAEFRAGLICWYADEVLGIRYNEHQKDGAGVEYTDPADLFLDGVIDGRRRSTRTAASSRRGCR